MSEKTKTKTTHKVKIAAKYVCMNQFFNSLLLFETGDTNNEHLMIGDKTIITFERAHHLKAG